MPKPLIHTRVCKCQKLGRSWAQHPCVLIWIIGQPQTLPPDAEPADPIEDKPADDDELDAP